MGETTGERPVRVLLADPAPMHRSGLRMVLAAPADGGAPEIVVAGETGDGAEAVELARRLLPDVLIAEIPLPRLDGPAVARAVTAAGLPVRVLILTAHDGDEDVLGAIAAGAAGFVRKDAPPAELVAAVRAVAAGGAVITPAVLARILTRVAEALPAPEILYYDNLLIRFLATQGRDLYFASHPTSHRCLAREDCPFFAK